MLAFNTFYVGQKNYLFFLCRLACIKGYLYNFILFKKCKLWNNTKAPFLFPTIVSPMRFGGYYKCFS